MEHRTVLSPLPEFKVTLRAITPGPVYWFDVKSSWGVTYDAHHVVEYGTWIVQYPGGAGFVTIYSSIWMSVVAACQAIMPEPPYDYQI